MPTGSSWQKSGVQASAAQRAEMVALAIAGEPAFLLDRREIERAGPTYTIDTLAGLRVELGAAVPLGTSILVLDLAASLIGVVDAGSLGTTMEGRARTDSDRHASRVRPPGPRLRSWEG